MRNVEQQIVVEDYYNQFGPMVLRRCRKLLKNEDLALDAMQDTFVQLMRYSDRTKITSPSSFLYRIATNICLNKIRAVKNRRLEDLDTLEQIASLEQTELRIQAKNLLRRLFKEEGATFRTIAVLYFLDGMTLKEVAEVAGMSISSVRRKLVYLTVRLKNLEKSLPVNRSKAELAA